ncbi:MAG TPA: phosphatase PAP2 family protein [Acidimicrobiia bacterium]|nr:phosphatase PAP2 family protein [Acidimicrobiia bacterium]
MGAERNVAVGRSRSLRVRISVAFVAAASLLALTLLVDKHRVADREVDVDRWFNDAPAWVAHALWPVMQLGLVWAPIVVGLVAAWFYGWRRGLAVVVAGLAGWFLAKQVKHLVERGRPLRYIPDVNVREGAGTGLGFVSGHTTIAFAMATVLAPVLPRWGRVVAFALATLVGVARVVYGAHLPLDVVGGACLGIVIGCVVDLVLLALPLSRNEERA